MYAKNKLSGEKNCAETRAEETVSFHSLVPFVPGKDIEIKVDHVYGRDEALKVIEASMADYESEYGHLHANGDS